MKNTKKMTQKEFDYFLTMELIPELSEEYGEFDIIILKEKSFSFAKTCPICGDLILFEKEYDLCKEILITDTEAIKQYLELITALDVIEDESRLECECYSDEEDEENNTNSLELYDELEEDTDIDLDEDYGDGKYEK